MDGVKNCLRHLMQLRSFGHFHRENYLPAARELLSSIGEAHSAYNSTLILCGRGINAIFVDLSGWRDQDTGSMEETIAGHLDGLDFATCMAGVECLVTDIATVREGDPCPLTGEPLRFTRGIEVGNIFQLGTKYTEAMHCDFLDRDGKSHPMVMGCYGIGVGRAMAAVIEQSNDEYGPVWPLSIAPWQVEICAVNPGKDNVGEICEKLYSDLQSAGIEVLYDDRGEKAGSMFSDADLLGIPFRIVVSPKTLADGQAEFKLRSGREAERIALEEVPALLKREIEKENAKFL